MPKTQPIAQYTSMDLSTLSSWCVTAQLTVPKKVDHSIYTETLPLISITTVLSLLTNE